MPIEQSCPMGFLNDSAILQIPYGQLNRFLPHIADRRSPSYVRCVYSGHLRTFLSLTWLVYASPKYYKYENLHNIDL